MDGNALSRGIFALTFVTLMIVTGVACEGGGGSSAGEQSTRTTPTSTVLPRGSEPVTLDPAEFTTRIDNPYWPMTPGSRWVYRETDAEGSRQRVEVTVTSRTKTIIGIAARVVHDVVTEEGRVVEDTYDWYAQDARGNVWYLGEDTKEYNDGKVSTSGSWEAGVDGAQPGVVIPAHPVPGLAYRQEYLAGEAEDAAKVLGVSERASVPYGSFRHVLLTREFTPLEPKLVEHKFYARGIGPVLATTVAGGSDREQLIRYERGP
jgi:hypothetical protein